MRHVDLSMASVEAGSNAARPGRSCGHRPGVAALTMPSGPGRGDRRPCVRGLRVRVADILETLAAGAGRKDILADYPYLEDGDITTALEYAARQSDHTVLHVA